MNGKPPPAVSEAEARAQTIDIPDTVRVSCPLVQFKLRAMGEHCPGCPHFRGLEDRFPGSSHAFAVRYTVKCAGEPARRPLYELEAAAAEPKA
jgi:hypothetical protein